jgi:hypothetical protein
VRRWAVDVGHALLEDRVVGGVGRAVVTDALNSVAARNALTVIVVPLLVAVAVRSTPAIRVIPFLITPALWPASAKASVIKQIAFAYTVVPIPVLVTSAVGDASSCVAIIECAWLAVNHTLAAIPYRVRRAIRHTLIAIPY